MDPSKIVRVGLVLSVFFLLLDAGVDAVFFDEEEQGYLHSLLYPEPMDRWMRFLFVCLLMGFTFFVRALLRQLQEKTDALQHERDLLEHRITEATSILRDKNAQLEAEVSARQAAESSLKQLVMTDPLTQLYNRRKLMEDLEAGLAFNLRYRTGLAVILCDIDHFKTINDRFGHDVGDRVLCHFAKLIGQTTRKTDTLARWGVEEFILLTPISDPQQAHSVAEKLRQLIEQEDFQGVGRVTASFGVALANDDETSAQLLRRADQALYAAKVKGRNIVELSPAA